MEAITTFNVADLECAERDVLQHILGAELRDNQQVTIRVADAPATPPAGRAGSEQPVLPEWCDVYAGLSDEEVDRLDRAIKQRLDLTRHSE